MKAIAHNLRSMIEIELHAIEAHKAEEQKLWDMAFEASKTDKTEGERIYRLAAAEEHAMSDATHKLRRLRSALWNILDIMGVEYDSFHPETAEF